MRVKPEQLELLDRVAKWDFRVRLVAQDLAAIQVKPEWSDRWDHRVRSEPPDSLDLLDRSAAQV